VSASPIAYRLYGLTLQSPLSLPCPRVDRGVRPDVRLRCGRAAQFDRARHEIDRARSTLDPARTRRREWFRCRQLANGTTFLEWNDLFQFLVSPDGRRILYRRLRNATRESFSVYLLGQTLSFSLVVLGREPLHGTVVAIGGRAVAFLGDCGYGKSTLAAALLARRFPLLTDDLVVLDHRDGDWLVHPGVPRLKLFPAVLRRLLGPVPGTPMNGGTAKVVLPLAADQTMNEMVRLHALYVLSDPAASARRTGPIPRIEPLSERDAFLEITRAAFNLFVLDRRRLSNQFAFAARLSATVPVRRLTYRRDLAALPTVCYALRDDVRSVRL